jgi:hypothetical protein
VTSLCALYIALDSFQQCLEKQQTLLYASREERPGNDLKAGNRLLYAIPSTEEEREPENIRSLSVARILNSATKVNVHTKTTIIITTS